MPFGPKFMERSRFGPMRRDGEKRKQIMTIKMRRFQLAVAAVLLACALTARAQTNTTTNIVTTTTTSIATKNNVVTTNTTTTTTTNIVQASPSVVAPKNPWKSSVAFGLTIARGNTDTTQASFTGTTQKKWLQNSLIFETDALYGESRIPNEPKQQETAEVLHGYSQYDRVFGDRFYGYGRIDGFHDGIADIKYRLTLSSGLGYYFVTNKTVDVMGEIGPGYIYEQLDGGTERFVTLRIAEKCHYIISPNAKAWETVEFLPQVDNFNNYIVNAELGIEAKLTKGNKLSLRSVLQDSYYNVPAPGRLKNDLKLITSVVYNF
jgi:putative salt-induced outer membrane protein